MRTQISQLLTRFFLKLGRNVNAACQSTALGCLTDEAERIGVKDTYARITNRFPAKQPWNPEIILYDQIEWSGKMVLDLGGGQGREALLFAEQGAKVVVIELDEKMIEGGKEACREISDSIKFVHADYFTYQTKEPIDIIYFSSVMYGTALPKKRRVDLLKHLHPSLKSDGQLILSYRLRPENARLSWRIHFWISRTTACLSFSSRKVELGDRLFSNCEPHHFFSEEEIDEELHQAGYSVRCKLKDENDKLRYVIAELLENNPD